MKNLITVLLTALLFSFNIFAQGIPTGSVFQRNHETVMNKMITGNVSYSDQFSSKVSPMLNYFLNRVTENNGIKVQLPESYSGISKVMFFYTDQLDQLIIPLLIKSNSVETTKGNILSAGGRIGTTSGDIISAEVPVSSVKSLIESSETIYLEASTISELKLDVSRTEIKVNQLHSGTGISRPYKGNGVVVGVLDSGIDWTHLDFKNAGGNRIQYLWDMSGSGNPPAGYNYGREYTKANLDANQCQEIDGDDGAGHGTHVAGTAAGNGGANGNYMGMAPESDIVFVKGFRTGPGFANTDVVDGCNYIFQKAGLLGKPSVINLSLGGHFSPHDGSSLYEQALNNLTGNGKIIVAAAGNEGGSTIHLSYATAGSTYNDSYETFIDLYNGANIFVSDMWYNGGNISVGLAAYSTTTLQLIGYTNGIPPGQKIEDLAFTISGTTYGYVTIDATGINNPNNGANEVLVVIDSHNGQVNIGNVFWSLYTYGSGTFDAWAVTGGAFSTFNGQSWFRPGDALKTIGSPSTAGKIICIGSYVTKNSWVDINGVTQNQPGNPTIGSISYFSSIGPTRDGRMKPDLAAPGEVIIAAYSSFLTQTPASNILLGGKHQKMQGTSMASPHVTGVVALMLEKNGTLNYDQTVALLKNSARQDGFTGATPNNTFGSGKLDGYTAFVNTTGGGGGTQVTLLQQGFDQTFPPAGWTTQVLNSSYTWIQGNPQGANFNQIDPASTNSAICPWVAQNQNEWLISPTFALGNGAASVEFYAAYSTQYLSFATLKLHISINGGANWQEIWTADNDGQPFMWRQKAVDLSAYANQQNIKLGWQYVGNDGDLVGLDGVKIVGFPTSVEEIDTDIPAEFELSYNYPNPFNPSTKFRYALPEARDVKIIVYDIIGTKVAELVNDFQTAGTYEVTWNGRNDLNQQVASGTYFFSVKAGDFVQTRKMILLK